MLAMAAFSVLVTGLVLLAIISLTGREQQRLDNFGTATARALAELAVEPLMRQDRMHLGVIGNRLAELPEITGVASYSTDNQLLTTTGDLHGPQYTQPVTIDDSIVGYVRLALEPEAFAAAERIRTGAILIALLLLPLLISAAWHAIELLRARAPPSWWRPAPEPAVAASPTPEPTLPAEDIRHYLLAVNLYNQLTLPRHEREFELSLCLEFAEAVAGIYHGQVVALPGVGALVDFDHGDDEDRPFQVLCAAFVLARLLHDEAPLGTYRLGLNLTECPADETLPLDHEAIADAALLSALGKDTALALSATFAEAVGHVERIDIRALDNPLLDELTTSAPACRLAVGLQPPFAGLVQKQAARLKAQRDAVSSPSTF
ncbi:MAG: hypothetical protein RIC56_07115 [Pseudomonadales bacterium]